VCLDPFVIVGSANVSRASVQTLVEAAMVTDHPAGLAEARALISRLQEHATRIDERFLKRIEALPVERAAPVRGRRIALEPDRPARAWLVGLHAIDEHPDEAALVEKGEEEAVRVRGEGDETISWLRFTGTSRFRRDAARGDTVLQIWRESRKAKDGSVFFPVPILHRQDEPTCARFFVPEPDRPVRPPLAWRRFLTLWSDVNGGTPPSLSTARLLTDEVAERLIAAWPTKRA
jgi:hypothetical protein